MTHKPCILMIDDASMVRLYHRGILEAQGYEVDEAINGIEALEKVLSRRFDLYLVDVNMPKLDGYGFLRELRRQAIPQAPALMISTEAQPQDLQRALDAGANFYLVKPIRPDVLTSFCRLLLQRPGDRP